MINKMTLAGAAFACALMAGEQPRELAAQVSAGELVRQYADHGSVRALEVAGYPCPADNAYRDEVFRGLLALEQTPARVSDLAGAWRYALRICTDPRLGAWYREQIRSTTDMYAAIALGIALSEAPTPDNLAALKDAVLGARLPEEVRGAMLAEARSVPAEEQIGWLLDGYLQGRTIPFRQLLNRFQFGVIDGPAGNRVRVLLLNALVQRPDFAQAPDLITLIAGDALAARSSTAWRRQARQALDAVADNTAATPVTRSAARQASEIIARIIESGG